MDLLINTYPKLDLHGYDRESARVAVEDFILENKMMGREYFVVVHGHGLGVVKQAVFEVIKNSRDIEEYRVNIYNDGEVIVKLKKSLGK